MRQLCWSSCEVPYRCTVRFQWKLHFLDRLSENTPNVSFMKIHPVGGAELFHAHRWTDGRTDGHDEGNSRF
jgi:hypothetical protein